MEIIAKGTVENSGFFLSNGYTVVTHSPPTSEVSGSNPGPYVKKMVFAYRWSAVYSTEP